MATIYGLPGYTGSLGELSAYRLRGTDRIIIRRKSGPSKKQIKQNHRFEMTRRSNENW
jgi:hypothetical protein